MKQLVEATIRTQRTHLATNKARKTLLLIFWIQQKSASLSLTTDGSWARWIGMLSERRTRKKIRTSIQRN